MRYFAVRTRLRNKILVLNFRRLINKSVIITVSFPTYTKVLIGIQGVSRLVDIIGGGDFLGLCDQKSSYKHVSDFERLRIYGHFLIPVHGLV